MQQTTTTKVRPNVPIIYNRGDVSQFPVNATNVNWFTSMPPVEQADFMRQQLKIGSAYTAVNSDLMNGPFPSIPEISSFGMHRNVNPCCWGLSVEVDPRESKHVLLISPVYPIAWTHPADPERGRAAGMAIFIPAFKMEPDGRTPIVEDNQFVLDLERTPKPYLVGDTQFFAGFKPIPRARMENFMIAAAAASRLERKGHVGPALTALRTRMRGYVAGYQHG